MPIAVAILPPKSGPRSAINGQSIYQLRSGKPDQVDRAHRQFRPIFRQMPKKGLRMRAGGGATHLARWMVGPQWSWLTAARAASVRSLKETLAELSCRISSRHLRVAWFDSEPALQQRLSVWDSKRELLRVAPRTPMRDTMEAGLAVLDHSPHPHAMIAIAEEQFYPTSVPASRPLQRGLRPPGPTRSNWHPVQTHQVRRTASRIRTGTSFCRRLRGSSSGRGHTLRPRLHAS